MNKVFFKDTQGNYFDANKIVGLFKAASEEGGELHFFALVENVGQVEITSTLFTEFVNGLLVLEAKEPEVEETTAE